MRIIPIARHPVECSSVTGLPTLPYRNRRKLDAQWAEALLRYGIDRFGDGRSVEPPSELRRAVDQFNRGEFWECHETLEDVWRETHYPFRLFYHSIIKTSVGFHHISAHNGKGARIKLRDGVELLALFQPHWMGVRTDRLRADATEWLSLIEGPGVDWSALDDRAKPCIATLAPYSSCP